MANEYNFEYLSDFLSTGKTEANINEAIKASDSGLNVIICSPTKQHSMELERRFHEKGRTAKRINENTTKTPVLLIEQWLSNNEVKNAILLVTHSAFIKAQKGNNRSKWVVFYDEKLASNHFEQINLTVNRGFVTKYIEQIKESDKKTTPIKIRKKHLTEIKNQIRNEERDDISNSLSDIFSLFSQAIHGEVELLVKTDDFREYMKTGTKPGEIFVWATPKAFEGFHRVVFTSAFFDRLMWKIVWEGHYKVNWKVAEEHRQHLRGITTKPIRLMYFLEDINWSIKLQETVMIDGKPITEFMIDKIINHFGKTEPVLGLVNKKFESLLGNNIQICPQNSAGLNDYSDILNFFSLKAMNAKPQEYVFYERHNLIDELKFVEVEQTLQAFFRCKVRDFSDKSSVNCLVASSLLAETIKNILIEHGYDDVTLEQFPLTDDEIKLLKNKTEDHRQFNKGRPKKSKMDRNKRLALQQKQRRLKTELNSIEIKSLSNTATIEELERMESLRSIIDQIGQTLIDDTMK